MQDRRGLDEITVNGKRCRIERLEGTVLSADKAHVSESRGSGENKFHVTVVRDNVFLRDAQGTEHVLRLLDTDVVCREGHTLVAIWLVPEKQFGVARKIGTSLTGDTFNLALIYNRDTDEANWNSDTGIINVYPLSKPVFLVIGGFVLPFAALILLGGISSILGTVGAVLVLIGYIALARKHLSGARVLRNNLLDLAKEPVQVTSP